jgi:hypothetical protein
LCTAAATPSPFDGDLCTRPVLLAFTRYSTPVQNFAPLLLPIGNDQASELFYNYAVTGILLTTPSRVG